MAWSLVWRMVACGLTLGVSLGAACGCLIGLLGMIIGYPPLLPEGAWSIGEFLESLVLGVLMGVPLGAIAGAALGSVAGLVLGALCGLALFAVTQAFFFGSRRGVVLSRYRAVAGWTCAAVTLAALLTIWAASGFETDAFAVYPNPAGAIDEGLVDLVFVTILPTLLATSAAWYSGRRVAESWACGAQGSAAANNTSVSAEGQSES